MGIVVTRAVLVAAPVESVWALLTNPRRVARCLPGAEILGQLDGTMYAGRLAITFGPIPTSYEGTVTFDRIDRSTWTTVARGLGRETEGSGTSELRVTTRLLPRSLWETEIAVQAEVTVTGIFAQFGTGAVRDMTELMFDRFTAAMRGELEEPTPGHLEPPGGGPPTSLARQERTAAPINVLAEARRLGGALLRHSPRRLGLMITLAILLGLLLAVL